jgi:hypothetical protein
MSIMILGMFLLSGERLINQYLAQAFHDTHVLQAVAYQWGNWGSTDAFSARYCITRAMSGIMQSRQRPDDRLPFRPWRSASGKA